MNPVPSRLILLATALLLPAAALRAAPEKYQVTGPITAMDANTLTVLKGGKEKFVMARGTGLKITGGAEPKVGDNVTVQYTITATDVEIKSAKGGAAVTKEASKPAANTPTAPAPAPKPAAGTR